MLRNPAKKNAQPNVTPTPSGKSAEEVADRLIDLTKRIRFKKSQDNYWSRDDFHKAIKLGGRSFLVSDLFALFYAYVLSVGAATSINIYNHASLAADPIANGTNTFAQFIISVGLGLTVILWLDTKGHYRQRLPYWESLGHFAKAASVGFICGGFIQYALKDSFSRLQLGMFWVLFGVLILTGRTIVRHILVKRKLWQINAVIVGNKNSAKAIVRALESEPDMGFNVVDMLSSDSLHNMLGPNAWKQLLMLYEASHVFVALEGSEMDAHHLALKAMVRSRIPQSIVPPWLGLPSSNVSPHHFMMHDVFFLHNASRLRMPILRFFKRGFDIVAAGCAVAALSPIFLFTAIKVRQDGGPALFSQPRVGRNGKLFPCYKFRSMRVNAEESLQEYLASNPDAAEEWAKFQKLKNDIRITPFGNFIRRTSIDELPQLLNVLKGDMSLVGPRPIMPEQAELYGDDFCFYEAVRPGITGPWQVSGRNKLTFKERIALESWYARNWNPWTDIVIILKTFPALLKRGQAL